MKMSILLGNSLNRGLMMALQFCKSFSSEKDHLQGLAFILRILGRRWLKGMRIECFYVLPNASQLPMHFDWKGIRKGSLLKLCFGLKAPAASEMKAFSLLRGTTEIIISKPFSLVQRQDIIKNNSRKSMFTC